ncbi:cyclic GMP-binding protein C-like [Saccostrea echinata]|uniref:cyclic GMP-binding protein C-like n=1 Tax=Saccostrea echinata TaxID=191078 RepID=UPI002A801730|nr:cyclic GMP-binding protein C-like [Saccostrea echinata]
MPRGGGSRSSGGSSGGGRSYVDNSYNRSLGRVGMPVGSMVVSSGGSRSSSASTSFLGSSFGGNSSSGRSYVDNAYNRNLGRVGMPVGSMVVSKGSSRPSSASASVFDFGTSNSGRTYVDNAQNRQLGRVGMPVGSMPFSSSSSSSSSKTYVDNEYNRRLGRVGMEHGAMVVSKSSSDEASSRGTKHYVDNSLNRSLGRVGLPHGACADVGEVRLYKDNAFNRRLGRVGKPLGTAVQSKSGLEEYKVYADNSENRRLGRVGFPVGSRPKASFSGTKRTYRDNSLNRALKRVGEELGTRPVTCSRETEWIHKAYQRYRENPDAEIQYQELPALPEEMETDAIEKIMDLFNRLQFEREWREKSKTKPVPKTEDALLHYTGPMVEFSDLELGRIIGRGGFGVVYHAKYNGSVVAVKKLHVTRVSKRRQKEFTEEVNILSKLDHSFIVKFIGACTTTPNLCIVMEYMQMSLYEALHVDSADLADFTDEDRLAMIMQTLTGLEYLHEKNVAHCDIKSRNILIDHDGEKFTVAKLSDFGLSMMKNETETSLSSSHEAVRNVGTPRYSSPEVLRGELLSLDQMKMSDMYSYALVVFEIVCEEEPFANLSAAQLRTQVGEKGLYPQFPKDVDPDINLVTQLLGCWERKPTDRPTASSFLRIVNRLSCVYEKTDW